MIQSGLLIILLILLAGTASAQTLDPESNWNRETNRGENPYTGFEFRHYTEADVLRAKEKHLRIQGESELDEWEGEYQRSTMLGRDELLWNTADGFVRAYSYHTLVGLNYGTVSVIDDAVLFRSEKVMPAGSKRVYSFNLIKVKIGTSHFLVPQENLKDFSAEAAGLIYKRDEDEDDDYWIKTSDEKLKVFGMPVFPKRFAHLVRNPITTRIIKFGKPKLHFNRHENGEVYSIEHIHPVYLNAGRSQGIRPGMRFYVHELDEWIDVRSVDLRTSLGELTRWELDIGKGEQCFVDNMPGDDARLCKQLTPGLAIRTLSETFNY